MNEWGVIAVMLVVLSPLILMVIDASFCIYRSIFKGVPWM